ncbi:MAG: cation diffusion facilitator family transporter [Candidatus Omnitrophica bacterium]|nr:cation diffusion facilitator family transporter [Candidatus Omnitrophota bacterium]MDD5430485.1 cation diffusion facilitator family transporter [Candidatus Omnitrophota bacterium]
MKNVSGTRTRDIYRVTWIGLLTNALLTVFKLLAGFSGKSSALVADGFHSLSDFSTDIVVLLGFRIVDKPADKDHDYGHGKFETLISAVIGIVLFFVGIKIFSGGLRRIIFSFSGGVLSSPGWIAFWVAAVSIVVKEWLYRYTIRVAVRVNSKAVVANAWHHRSDVFSSVGTVLGIGGAIVLGERWRILDPLAAIVVCVFIIKVAVTIFLSSVGELLETSLNEEAESKILEIVKSTPGVQFPHNMKTRTIGSNVAIDIHIKVDKGFSIVQAHDIATKVEEKLKNHFGERTFVSVHTEPCD